MEENIWNYRIGFLHGAMVVLAALIIAEIYFAKTAPTAFVSVEPETLTPSPELPKKKTTRKRPSKVSG